MHDRRAFEHPQLYGINWDILKYRVYLILDRLNIHIPHRQHPVCVFCNNGSDYACSIYAVCRKGFQIRLYTCPAAAIGAGN